MKTGTTRTPKSKGNKNHDSKTGRFETDKKYKSDKSKGKVRNKY